MLSRVADNLYWMSRYLERAEHVARLLDVNLDETLDRSGGVAGERWTLLLDSLQIEAGSLKMESGELGPNALLKNLAVDTTLPASIGACVSQARENARQVREQISSEMWLRLNRLYQDVRRTNLKSIWRNSPHEYLDRTVKEGVQLFQGVTDATMSHGEGWHFIQLGRFVERAQATSTLLKAHFPAGDDPRQDDQREDDLAWIVLLKSCTSFEAYCKVYTATMRPEWVAEFLLLNPESPRSVRFAAERILVSARAIATLTGKTRGDQVTRFAGRLSSLLDYAAIDEILEAGLPEYCDEVRHQCLKVHQAIYDRYIQPREIVMT